MTAFSKDQVTSILVASYNKYLPGSDYTVRDNALLKIGIYGFLDSGYTAEYILDYYAVNIVYQAAVSNPYSLAIRLITPCCTRTRFFTTASLPAPSLIFSTQKAPHKNVRRWPAPSIRARSPKKSSCTGTSRSTLQPQARASMTLSRLLPLLGFRSATRTRG